MYGQLAARVESNGFLKYYKYENIEDEVQKLMDKWLTKNSGSDCAQSRARDAEKN